MKPIEAPAAPAPPPIAQQTTLPTRTKSRWLLWSLLGALGVVLLTGSAVAAGVWWLQRPIKPVVLNEKEAATVQTKLRMLEGASAVPVAMRKSIPAQAQASAAPDTTVAPVLDDDRPYVPGSKVLKLTERELNGLLNANTDLGQTVRIELGRNAINAYLAVPIPQDFPMGGGKMFRARGRFSVSIGNGGAPYAILEDVTIYGLSLPKAWLGGLKGENLISSALGEREGAPLIQGVKSLRVEPGTLVLEVED